MDSTLSNITAAWLNRCSSLVRAALPQRCLLCAARSGAALLCAACEAVLPRLSEARCTVCALPVAGASVCGACLNDPPYFHKATAAFAYSFPLDALVQSLKYGGNLVVARLAGEALAAAVATERVDLIVPMPLSTQRLRERGFNQALEIARYVGRARRIPVVRDACRRVVHTAAQAALPWKARARNVRGAFVCDADLHDRSVAVIDDVMTTGATLNELARNLRRAGAREIRAWVVARTLKTRTAIRR